MYYHDFFYDSQLPLPGRGGTVDLMPAGGEVEGSRHTAITDPRQFHASGIFVCAIVHIKQGRLCTLTQPGENISGRYRDTECESPCAPADSEQFH